VNTPEWIKYDGSDKQIEALASVKTMIRVRYVNGREVNWSYTHTLFKSKDDAKAILETAIAYLICQPHPYADLIKIWADTGCPVWWRDKKTDRHGECLSNGVDHYPFYAPEHYRYSLTPFED